MFNKNAANWDRIVRVVVGIVLLFLGFGGMAAGTTATVLGILGAILFFTGLVGFCPLYALFKFSTKKA